jgi:dihydroxyacetone kinase
MTSLDMHGFSVSPFPATKADEAALQKPVTPRA